MLERMIARLRGGPAGLGPSVSRPVWFVGDLHGRADALDALLARLRPELNAAREAGGALVFLGDYVDRGPDSAAVLTRLRRMVESDDLETVCLIGNHERMMLDFMDDPVQRGRFWMRNGGARTLESFGLPPVGADGGPRALRGAATALRAALAPGMEEWLRNLPLQWSHGELACVHAGMDPARPATAQDPDVMVWGHPDFAQRRREDALWVAHGHTVVERPAAEEGRIAVDTGAWRTGRLTAGCVRPGDAAVSFESVQLAPATGR